MVTRKSRREIEKMRHAGRIVAEVLALVEAELKPGVTTGHLDRLAEKHIRDAGAVPSFKGYGHRSNPFPASLCISIDDEVVHGIPGDRTIREGQVVSIDAGAIYDGWHGDGARTFFVGEPKPGVGTAHRHDPPGDDGRDRRGGARAHLGDISAAIEDVARPNGYGIVRQFVGHGIGTEMHQEPQVPNYRTGVRGHEAPAGDLPRDRADAHARRPRGRRRARRLDRRRRATARWRPTSSTRSPSRTTVREILTTVA